MFIESNNYSMRTLNKDIFTQIHKSDLPISHLKGYNNKFVFSSKNEIFASSANGSKKIAELDSNITCLSNEEEMLCAGTKNGEVRIFCDFKKSIRVYNEHKAGVNDIKIIKDRILVSCSDDSKLIFYNLEDEKSFKTIKQDEGYIKCIDHNKDYLFSGSKSLNIYSKETFELIATYNHGSEITKLCALTDDVLVFSSKNKLFLFDIKSTKILDFLIFPDTITEMISFKGMLYISLFDGHFKTFTHDFVQISNFTFKNRIIDFFIFEDRPFIALDNQTIMGLAVEPKKKELKNKLPSRPSYEDNYSYETLQQAKRKCTDVEFLLRKFEYKKALNLVFERKDIDTSFAVFKALQEKRGLMKALKDEKEIFVEKILLFCIEHFHIPEFNPILIECLVIVTTIYAEMIVENDRLKELLHVLSDVVNEEVAFQETSIKTLSFLNCFEI